jgi:hypothetical protein
MSMRIPFLLGAAALVASCASDPTSAPAPARASRAVVSTIALSNAGFEDKPREGEACARGWGCSAHNNPRSFRFAPLEAGVAEGARSYCAEAVGKEPWAKVTQGLRDAAMRGSRIRFSAMVKLEGVTGEGAGPIAIAQGASGQTIANVQALSTGVSGWKRVEVELDVPQATTILEVGMVFIGRGKACLDDARLEVLAPGGAV